MSESLETVYFQEGEVQIFSLGGYPPSTIRCSPPPTLILIGPGCPGIVNAYQSFARTLYKRLQLPLWVHSFIDHGRCGPHPSIEPKHRLPSQIAMTKYLINEYLQRVRIICVDHSTSCYIILQVLRDPEIEPRIIEAYFLMPVITKPDNWKGSIVYWSIRSKVVLALCEAYAFFYNMVPERCQRWLEVIYYIGNGYRSVPDLPLNRPGDFRKGFRLGQDLLETEIDLSPFAEFSDRLHIFCSAKDDLLGSWALALKLMIPSIDIKEHDSIPHIFFVDESEVMGNIVADWINETSQKKHHDFCKFLKIK